MKTWDGVGRAGTGRVRSRRAGRALLEALEPRTLLSGTTLMSGTTHPHGRAATAAGPVGARGFTVTTFAASPAGASQPDSIAVDGSSVYVGYQNGGLPDGSDGKASTIVQYSAAGTVVKTYTVPGHNDGLKVDPATHLLWSMQNEDANPNLVIIDPVAGTQTQYAFAAAPAAGGGYDDITFLGGKVYFSASNPARNPNDGPAIVQATLSGTTVTVAPVLAGNAAATGAKHKGVTLNLQDPDSMTADPAGELFLTSQADNEVVTVANPGAASQAVSVLPLVDAKKKPVSVDDTLFVPNASGTILVTDTKAGTIYSVSGPKVKSGLVLSAAPDVGGVGMLNRKTGRFTPVVTGLSGPHGLAFLSLPTASKGFAVKAFAANPAGTSQPDSIAVDGTSVYVGYQNGVAKDGSDGKTSTIVQYDSTGTVVKTFSVPGHNDGLKVDPTSHLLWALQNEDANPNLVIISPAAGTQAAYTFAAAPAAGGGYDDITFVGGRTYFSESNPSQNPNTAPAIVQATLSGTTVTVTPVLSGNAKATVGRHKSVTLNLQDPDSMTADPAGDLFLTSQADDQVVTVKHPGAADQTVSVLPLVDAKKKAVSVDDTLFTPGGAGSVLLTDQGGAVYQISGPAVAKAGVALSAAPDVGRLGVVNLKTGRFTPVLTGLSSPRGLAFL